MVPFNLALVVTSLVVISIHVFIRRRSRLFCFSKDASAIFKAQIKNICPRQGPKIAGVVLHRVGIFSFFCPKQGQGLRPSAAHLYPNVGRVPPSHSPPGIFDHPKGSFYSIDCFIRISKQQEVG